jgi:hypothetical protein
MNMGNIRNKKLMPIEKITQVAEKECVKQCALEAKETTKWAKF